MSFVNSLFISNAVASETAQNAAGAASNTASFTSFIPLILIFIVFYFLLIRPQQKKIKEHQNLINNLKISDKVCTTSGIFGVIKEIDAKENQVQIEIASGVVIKVLRSSIGEVIGDKKADNDNKKSKKSKK